MTDSTIKLNARVSGIPKSSGLRYLLLTIWIIPAIFLCACDKPSPAPKTRDDTQQANPPTNGRSTAAAADDASTDEKPTAAPKATPENTTSSNKKSSSKPIAVKTPATPQALTSDMSPKQMYTAYCGACHSVDLVESQRLSRDDWAWVMTDMVEEYGGAWIKPAEQEIIIDYLAEHFGPQ